MNWLIFALMAPIFWGITNVIDKFLMTKFLNKAYFLPMWIGIFGLPTSAFVFLFFKPIFIYPYSIIAIFLGFVYSLSYLVYAKILINEEVSRAISLTFLYPILVTIMAGIFLKEVFGFQRYVGIFLLVISGLLVSYKKEGKKISIIKSLKLIILLIIIWSCIQVTEKFVVDKIGNWSIYFWINVGLFLSILPIILIKTITKNFVNSFKKIGKRGLSTLVVAQCVSVCSSVSYYIAISLGPVSMVSAIGSLQPFFVLIYSVLLTIFVPKFLKENLNKYNIFMKSIAIIFVLVGTWLLV
jgi:drug/metabolite transporter (DMT)-like permease